MTRLPFHRRVRLAHARPQRWDPTGLRRRRRAADPRRYLQGVVGAALFGLAVLPSFGDAVNAALKPGFGLGGAADGCMILAVIDGDTVTLWCPGRAPERARLTGFDAPELFSPGCLWEAQAALRAKWQLRLLVWGADGIGVVRQGRDRYGRALVALTLDGRPVADAMIEAGLARGYDGGRRDPWCGIEAAAAPAPMRVRAGRSGERRGTTAKWVTVDG